MSTIVTVEVVSSNFRCMMSSKFVVEVINDKVQELAEAVRQKLVRQIMFNSTNNAAYSRVFYQSAFQSPSDWLDINKSVGELCLEVTDTATYGASSKSTFRSTFTAIPQFAIHLSFVRHVVVGETFDQENISNSQLDELVKS